MRLVQKSKLQTGIAIVELNGRTIQIPLFSEFVINEVRNIPNVTIKSVYLARTLSDQATELRHICENYERNKILSRKDMDKLRAGFYSDGRLEQESHLSYYE